MKTRTRGEPVGGGAFTLIELLIVVAIIAILAAIAVPNFLEAQVRAKVAKNMNDMRNLMVALQAYRVDWNDVIRDQNDADTPPDQRGMTFFTENPGIVADLAFIGDRNWMASFYTFRQFRPLTTPIGYMTFRPIDSFSRVVPFGLDTREIGSRNIVYFVFLSSGPDKDDGDWYRGNNPSNRAVKYDPTNGTVSNGDVWRGEAYSSTAEFNQEYPYAM
jgi:prepilin-type N-terminal cleavage/methylation domain-containing protein